MIGDIVDDAIAAGVTPGGVVVAGDASHQVVSFAFGTIATASDIAVDLETIYDIASLTKPIATAGVLMRLCARGDIRLDDAVPGLDGVSVRHLVGHAAGFPDHVEFFRRIWAGDLAGQPTARRALFEMARSVEAVYPPGSKTIYSDIGYILLGEHLERVTNRRQDELVRELVTDPLDMTTTHYVDLESPQRLTGVVAPTEHCDVRGLLVGEVHDENAHAAGGVCGHAGLFSTGLDVAKFARAINDAFADRPSIFDPKIVRAFLSTSAAPETTWRLGWDTPSDPAITHAGARWPKTGVGHLGFTGCSMWLDPPTGTYAVILTNRVHPTRPPDSSAIRDLRRAIMDVVASQLLAS